MVRIKSDSYGMPVYGIYKSTTDEIEIFKDMPKELVLKHELNHAKSRRLIGLLIFIPVLGVIGGEIVFEVVHRAFAALIPVGACVLALLLYWHLEIKAGYEEEIREKVEELKGKMG